MRRSLTSGLLAALTVVALGAVPALASADVVTLKDSAGKPLKLGTKNVQGTSNDTVFRLNPPESFPRVECGEIKFAAVVTANKEDPATIEPYETSSGQCFLILSPTEKYKFVIESLEFGPFDLFADETVADDLIRMQWSLPVLGLEECVNESNSLGGGAPWWAEPTWISEGTLAFSSYLNSSPSSPCSGAIEMESSFDLTHKGLPVPIEVEP